MKMSLRIRFFLWLLALLGIFVIVQTILYTGVELTVAHSRGTESIREQLMEVLFGVGMDILLLPFLALMAWWISLKMLQPIRSLARTAGEITTGDLHQRVETRTMPDDEMRALGVALNGAFDRYLDAIGNLESFTGDVAHQLRTPLASIRATAEVTLSKQRSENEYQETLGSVLEDVLRLSKVVDQMLTMARASSSAENIEITTVDLSDIARQSLQMYGPICSDLDVEIEKDIDDMCPVRGNTDLLMEAVRNLVDNALRYAGSPGRIRVSVTTEECVARLVVMDSGPGIDPEHRNAIFERFYRARPSESSGTGLGLALASQITRFFGGEITLETRDGWGGVFVITLPSA